VEYCISCFATPTDVNIHLDAVSLTSWKSRLWFRPRWTPAFFNPCNTWPVVIKPLLVMWWRSRANANRSRIYHESVFSSWNREAWARNGSRPHRARDTCNATKTIPDVLICLSLVRSPPYRLLSKLSRCVYILNLHRASCFLCAACVWFFLLLGPWLLAWEARTQTRGGNSTCRSPLTSNVW
jgi:hypothetical protein